MQEKHIYDQFQSLILMDVIEIYLYKQVYQTPPSPETESFYLRFSKQHWFLSGKHFPILTSQSLQEILLSHFRGCSEICMVKLSQRLTLISKI